jgi:hypothetical protein
MANTEPTKAEPTSTGTNSIWNAQLEQQCRGLELIATRYQVDLLFRGPSVTTQAAAQTSGLRDYAYGDDYRYVDWSVCARHDELFSKQFMGSEDRDVLFLVDSSPRMTREKLLLAKQLTLCLSRLALRHRMRVGAIELRGQCENQLPPRRQLTQWPRLLEFVNSCQTADQSEDQTKAGIVYACDSVLQQYRPAQVVLISDLFQSQGYSAFIRRMLELGHGIQMVQICEPQDSEPTWLGRLRLDSLASALSIFGVVDSLDLDQYRKQFNAFRSGCSQFARQDSIGFGYVSTEKSLSENLQKLLEMTTRVAQHRAWQLQGGDGS